MANNSSQKVYEVDWDQVEGSEEYVVDWDQVPDPNQAQQQPPQVPQATQDSLWKSIEDILYKREEEQQGIQQRAQERGFPLGAINYPLQTLGKTVVGTAADVGGEVAGRVLSPIANVVGLGVPEDQQYPFPKGSIVRLEDTEIGKSVLSGLGWTIDKWRSFSRENPDTAANIESLANLALAAPGGVAKAAFKEQIGKLLSAAVSPLETAATQQNISRAREIVRPDRELLSETERAALIRSTKPRGILRTLTIDLDKQEERAAELLGDVYNQNRTFTENYNAAVDFITEKSNVLQADLDKYPNIKTKSSDIDADINTYKASLYQEKPTLLELKQLNKRIVNNYNRLKDKYTKNGEIPIGDLYRLRKDFDSWWADELTSVTFEKGGNRTQAELLIQAIRNPLNAKIESLAPDEKYASRLYDMFSMLRANENVKLKATAEPANFVARKIEDIGGAVGRGQSPREVAGRVGRVGVKAGFAALPTAAAALLGGISTAAITAGATAAAGAGWGAYRVFKSPKLKRNIAQFVKAMDRDVTNAVWFSNRAAFIDSINNLYSSIEEESPLEQEEEQPK